MGDLEIILFLKWKIGWFEGVLYFIFVKVDLFIILRKCFMKIKIKLVLVYKYFLDVWF